MLCRLSPNTKYIPRKQGQSKTNPSPTISRIQSWIRLFTIRVHHRKLLSCEAMLYTEGRRERSSPRCTCQHGSPRSLTWITLLVLSMEGKCLLVAMLSHTVLGCLVLHDSGSLGICCRVSRGNHLPVGYIHRWPPKIPWSPESYAAPAVCSYHVWSSPSETAQSMNTISVQGSA